MTPSTYQAAVYDAVKNSNRNLFVHAVAGSGKTTTLEGIVKTLGASWYTRLTLVAFNNSIVHELAKRMPYLMPSNGDRSKKYLDRISTLHSFGRSACSRAFKVPFKANPYKYRNYAEEWLQPTYPQDFRGMAIEVDNLCNFARLTLTNLDDIKAVYAIIDHYDIGAFEGIIELAKRALARGIQERFAVMDFTDMLWLPVELGLSFAPSDLLLVDEAQDLNNLQREVIRRALGSHGRLIAVGDPNQAIMGFAGATIDSVDRIIADFDCQVMPLSVCYRCPSGHLDLAREFVPHIEARTDAIPGIINHVPKYAEASNNIEPVRNDLVLCRTNAPLVALAFQLLADRKPVLLKDADLVTQIKNLAEKALKRKGASWSKFSESVDQHVSIEVQKLSQRKGTDSRVSALVDRAEALKTIVDHAIAEGWTIDGMDQLTSYIQCTFLAEGSDKVKLSTVHRAKGLEADHVHILGYSELMPSRWASQGWEMVQERNLQYVAVTRAKASLSFIPMPPKD